MDIFRFAESLGEPLFIQKLGSRDINNHPEIGQGWLCHFEHGNYRILFWDTKRDEWSFNVPHGFGATPDAAVRDLIKHIKGGKIGIWLRKRDIQSYDVPENLISPDSYS